MAEMLKVKFLDLTSEAPSISASIKSAIEGVISSGRFIGGDVVAQFEEDFTRFSGAPNCVGVGNGLDAISILIRALGISQSKKILVPNNTFIATALAAVNLGYEIVPCDVDPASRNLSVETIERCDLDEIGLVVFVPLYGNPAGGSAVKVFCEQKGIPIIFDCAQAHGARVGNRPVAEIWENCTWSFYPGKNLGAYGDAGAITTHDAQLAHAIRAISNYGSTEKYVHEYIGVNSRLDPIQACVLSSKLLGFATQQRRRNEVANTYLTGIRNNNIVLPNVPTEFFSAWHLFVIEVVNGCRTDLSQYLTSMGIETLIHYPSTISEHACFKQYNLNNTGLTISERLSREILSIPMGPHLKAHEVRAVVQAINAWVPNV